MNVYGRTVTQTGRDRTKGHLTLGLGSQKVEIGEAARTRASI